jgi:uncharacterized protein YbdZ (MbtH family)
MRVRTWHIMRVRIVSLDIKSMPTPKVNSWLGWRKFTVNNRRGCTSRAHTRSWIPHALPSAKSSPHMPDDSSLGSRQPESGGGRLHARELACRYRGSGSRCLLFFSSFTKYRVHSKFLQFSNSNSLESFNQTCLQSKGLKLIDYHFYHLNNVAQDLSIWNLACGRPSPWTWGHNGHAHSVCQYISNYVIFQTLKSKLNIQTNFSLRKHCWYSLHMVHTIHFASS